MVEYEGEQQEYVTGERGERDEIPAESLYDVSAPNAEEQKIRQAIMEKFHGLANEIEQSNLQIFNLLRLKTEKKGRLYAKLTETQDADLFQELTKINVQLGMASGMLDSYIHFSDSTPEFKNFFNKIFNIMTYIRNHRSGIFFEVNVRDNDVYLYPYFLLENLLRELTLLYGRLRGHLVVAGDFIKDQPLCSMPRPASPATMSEYGMYNRPYYSGGGGYYNPLYDRYGEIGNRSTEKQRDIGDALDK